MFATKARKRRDNWDKFLVRFCHHCKQLKDECNQQLYFIYKGRTFKFYFDDTLSNIGCFCAEISVDCEKNQDFKVTESCNFHFLILFCRLQNLNAELQKEDTNNMKNIFLREV